MPRRQKKWKAGDGEAAASKNLVIQSMLRPSQYPLSDSHNSVSPSSLFTFCQQLVAI
ncbi:hypothetical protein DPMN_001985 [Dreissena polymorpha]|uniref:Uncharacterized protein n=1 Tax=Dreissena polymorpha TaxID=45954 RepID=A0A9D4CTA8_DREPO|nr:hypothetical protein DPMN_057277 [Dreissena polymorpha]KAH3878102.1 hypothetical protein DPMN_001985 [Dreissena polymorpha]